MKIQRVFSENSGNFKKTFDNTLSEINSEYYFTAPFTCYIEAYIFFCL